MGQTDPLPPLRATSADHLQGLPYPVVSFRKTYAPGYVSRWHSHPRHQLIYSVTGLMLTQTRDESWVVPAGHGLIICEGIPHMVDMVGEVTVETLYIDPAATPPGAFASCQVVSLSPLLALLIARLCDEDAADPTSATAVPLRELILMELARAPTSPFALRYPTDPQLRRVCDALAEDPSNAWSIDDWAFEIGKSRRSFTRSFHAQTGLTFRQWGQRLRYQLAVTGLAQGKPMERIAAELGYGSKYALEAMMRKLTGG